MTHYHEIDEHDNVGGGFLVLQPCEDSPCLRADPHLYICPSPAMHFPARETIILDWNDDA